MSSPTSVFQQLLPAPHTRFIPHSLSPGPDAELAEILARMPQLLNCEGGETGEGNQFQLVQEAAQGRDEKVRDILLAQPQIVSYITIL